jgi:aminoglycoside 3-N-acetyltransferase
MLGFRDLSSGLRQLDLDPCCPVMMHASLSAFGEIRGGAETLLGAVSSLTSGLMMPAFTYKTMIVPEEGPPDNGMVYGSQRDQNRMAEFYRPDMPVDPSLGVTAETLRRLPGARRSTHPALSFCGYQADTALAAQTIAEPLAPIAALAEMGGWVLLLGVNQTVNTSLHLAEQLAGRPQFTGWALTYGGVVECPNFPGCSKGFAKAAVFLEDLTRRIQIGNARVEAIPLAGMIERIKIAIEEDPQAFLCGRLDCAECSAVRRRLSIVDASE